MRPARARRGRRAARAVDWAWDHQHEHDLRELEGRCSMRVNMLRDGHGELVRDELELVEPSLFLRHDPRAGRAPARRRQPWVLTLVSAAMRRIAISLVSLLTLACTKPDPQAPAGTAKADPKANADASADAPEQPEWTPTRREPVEAAPKQLAADELPPAPTLETLTLAPMREGTFGFPDGSNELAPRAAVALGGGLLFAGQAYLDRRLRRPSSSWRWLGFTPTASDGVNGASSTSFDPGAIRAAIADGHGGALLCGTSGIGFDTRGWFGVVDEHAQLGRQVGLDSPTTTELFDLLPGAGEGELVVVAGYVDAQAWLVSLDLDGQQRWQKFVGSYGYTQAQAIARLDGARGDLLAIGTRAETFGESWSAKIPGDGGVDGGPSDVEQDKLSIEGADVNQTLRAIVDVGEAGYIALGTAKRDHRQAHDQALAVGFGRDGQLSWSRVVPELRVTEVSGARAMPGKPGVAMFVVEIPSSDADSPHALALLELSATHSSARALADSAGWSSAGFVEGEAAATVLSYTPNTTGISWRQLPVAN